MWGKESQHWSEKGRKKRKEKNITCVPTNGAMAAAGVGAREGCNVSMVACIPTDGIVWSSLLHVPWWWSLCNDSRCDNGSLKTTLKEEKVK